MSYCLPSSLAEQAIGSMKTVCEVITHSLSLPRGTCPAASVAKVIKGNVPSPFAIRRGVLELCCCLLLCGIRGQN